MLMSRGCSQQQENSFCISYLLEYYPTPFSTQYTIDILGGDISLASIMVVI
jgi:hypothetical protein